MGNINIAIVSKDTVFLRGIQSLVLNIFEFRTMSFASVDDVVQEGIEGIDIFITDSNSYISGIDFFTPRKKRTLVVTDYDVHTEAIRTIAKYSSEDDITDAIKSIAEELLSQVEVHLQLSNREVDVLRLLVKGMINKEIADTLNISVNTVLTHRKNISSKLGIKSVSGLSIYAIMNGYV